MNIREGNMLRRNPGHPVRDIHFRVRGPVLAQLAEQVLLQGRWRDDRIHQELPALLVLRRAR